MDSDKSTKRKKRRNFYRERFLTEPGQSLEAYGDLKAKWDKKLATSGFSDIEFVSKEGITSPFFRDYPTQSLARAYKWDKEEYYRIASLMYWHFPWRQQFTYRQHAVFKYIWEQHSKGLELSVITKLVKKRWKKTEKPTYGRSIFWVHSSLNTIRPIVFKWYYENIKLFTDDLVSVSDEIAHKRGAK